MIESIRSAAKLQISRSVGEATRPVFLFEIRPGKTRPGASDFGASLDLAHLISTELTGAHQTVAFVPEPLRGFAVLPALACGELVMGTDASLGPIAPDGSRPDAGRREVVRELARHKGLEPGLYLGLLDREADLHAIRTADKQLHYLLNEEIPEFARTHQIIEDRPAWEGGQNGILSSQRARDEGFARLRTDDILTVFARYRLAGGAANDPSLLGEPKPVWIRVAGPVNAILERYVSQRVQKARTEGVNLIFFEIDSDGGIDLAAGNLAQFIANVKDIKTVAFVNDRALGVSALLPFACDDIVMGKGAKIGDVSRVLAGGAEGLPLSDSQIGSLAVAVENLSKIKNHPSALAVAMVDPSVVLVSARDRDTGQGGYYLQREVDTNPGRYLDVVRIKEAGSLLTLSADEVVSHGLGRSAGDVEDLKSLYNLKGKSIRVDGPTWVDGVVQTLNDPFISSILLFIGIFMLILEVKMPGVGIPAIISVPAFLLFFWSRFLSGTADQLEILLFVVGLICLGLELFVFPGFGVFGISGVLLILVSIVMASHTFIWPTEEYQYREMLSTLVQVVGVLVSVGLGVAIVGRFLPSIPFLNRMILRPEVEDGRGPFDPSDKPYGDGEDSLAFLVGEVGRTTTVLRPAGKARFGDLLVDVVADGFYLESETAIEVVEVQGPRVVVKPVR